MDGNTRTLLGVVYIPKLARSFITIRNMSDVGIKICLKMKPIGWFEEKWY